MLFRLGDRKLKETHVKSYLTFRKLKSKSLMPMRIDDNTLTHERRKLVKTYKNALPQKRTLYLLRSFHWPSRISLCKEARTVSVSYFANPLIILNSLYLITNLALVFE